jgi:FMN phosphatase YigB (HAD superfamily)
VPTSEFDYALITSYEVMTCGKSHPAYYRQIAGRLGRNPDECLMVGDDWDLDVLPATRAGMPVYWIVEPDQPEPAIVRSREGGRSVGLFGQGTLGDLCRTLTAS